MYLEKRIACFACFVVSFLSFFWYKKKTLYGNGEGGESGGVDKRSFTQGFVSTE